MTAAYRLKGVGWVAACTAVVLGFYLVSLQVAVERKKLEVVNAQIISTQRDIRALETEFDTRANLSQLERWNGDTLALAAPRPAQFVRDEAELAATDPRGPLNLGGAEVKTAALVVPSLPMPSAPVPVAVPSAPVVAKAPPAKPVAAPAQMAIAKAKPSAVQMAIAKAKPSAPVQVAAVKAKPAHAGAVAYHPAAEHAATHSAALLRAKPEVAMLDHHLLSDSTLGDLLARARTEKGRGR